MLRTSSMLARSRFTAACSSCSSFSTRLTSSANLEGNRIAVSNQPRAACGLPFHQECWDENLGCAAYGCCNVNVLRHGADITIPMPPLPRPPGHPPSLPGQTPWQPPPSSDDEIPWEFVFLGGSAIAAIVSTATYGLPSLAVAAGAVCYAANARRPRWPILLAVWGISGLAVLIGLTLSAILQFN